MSKSAIPQPGTAAIAPPPSQDSEFRVIVRQLTDFLLKSAPAWGRPFGADYVGSLALRMIASANLARADYISNDGEGRWIGLDWADRGRRPISAHAIALSLGVPYETMRRRLAALCAAGVLERDRDGYWFSARAVGGPAFASIIRETYTDFTAVIEGLRDLGVDLNARATSSANPPPPEVVMRLVLAFDLRCTEHFADRFGNVTTGVVLCGIIGANVNYMAEDPELTRRYGAQGSPPPDALRRPVSARAVAAAHGLPAETVRRHVETLVEAGWVDKIGGEGLIVPTRIVMGEMFRTQHTMMVADFRRLMTDLARLGWNLPA